VRCAQAPSRPEGPRGGAKRSALYGAEQSAKLSHVMGGSLAPREPIPKLVDVAFRKPCDDVETGGQERATEVVDEESVNGDQNARRRRALPPC